MQIPKKLSPDPLVEAIIEIRFESSVPPEAIFGLIYSKIQSEFMSLEPIPQSQDNEAKSQPRFALKSNQDLVLNIGSQALVFYNMKKYVGWEAFSNFAISVINSLKETNIISKPKRVGLRYVNLFQTPILEKLNVSLSINGKPVDVNATATIRTEIKDGDYLKIVHIVNKATIQSPTFNGIGSIVDLDCIYGFDIEHYDIYAEMGKILEASHFLLINQFYELLKEDFVAQFNPTY